MMYADVRRQSNDQACYVTAICPYCSRQQVETSVNLSGDPVTRQCAPSSNNGCPIKSCGEWYVLWVRQSIECEVLALKTVDQAGVK